MEVVALETFVIEAVPTSDDAEAFVCAVRVLHAFTYDRSLSGSKNWLKGIDVEAELVILLPQSRIAQ